MVRALRKRVERNQCAEQQSASTFFTDTVPYESTLHLGNDAQGLHPYRTSLTSEPRQESETSRRIPVQLFWW
jgi:hypothetical protein